MIISGFTSSKAAAHTQIITLFQHPYPGSSPFDLPPTTFSLGEWQQASPLFMHRHFAHHFSSTPPPLPKGFQVPKGPFTSPTTFAPHFGQPTFYIIHQLSDISCLYIILSRPMAMAPHTRIVSLLFLLISPFPLATCMYWPTPTSSITHHPHMFPVFLTPPACSHHLVSLPGGCPHLVWYTYII